MVQEIKRSGNAAHYEPYEIQILSNLVEMYSPATNEDWELIRTEFNNASYSLHPETYIQRSVKGLRTKNGMITRMPSADDNNTENGTLISEEENRPEAGLAQEYIDGDFEIEDNEEKGKENIDEIGRKSNKRKRNDQTNHHSLGVPNEIDTESISTRMQTRLGGKRPQGQQENTRKFNPVSSNSVKPVAIFNPPKRSAKKKIMETAPNEDSLDDSIYRGEPMWFKLWKEIRQEDLKREEQRKKEERQRDERRFEQLLDFMKHFIGGPVSHNPSKPVPTRQPFNSLADLNTSATVPKSTAFLTNSSSNLAMSHGPGFSPPLNLPQEEVPNWEPNEKE